MYPEAFALSIFGELLLAANSVFRHGAGAEWPKAAFRMRGLGPGAGHLDSTQCYAGFSSGFQQNRFQSRDV